MTEETNSSGETRDEARRVHGSLREWILLGGIAAGSVIAVSTLVRRYGVRRADARRALDQLDAEGLVRTGEGDRAVVIDPLATRLGDVDALARQWERQRREPAATPGSDYP
ncbi:MAG: GntR family transcriptional regulator [Dehalococcoidia bacterium]